MHHGSLAEAIAERIAALGRFATPKERREIRLQERAKMRTSTPYYDMTFSAEKSVSLMYAGLLAAAKRARDEGDERKAERFRAEAGRIEAAVMAGGGSARRSSRPGSREWSLRRRRGRRGSSPRPTRTTFRRTPNSGTSIRGWITAQISR